MGLAEWALQEHAKNKRAEESLIQKLREKEARRIEEGKDMGEMTTLHPGTAKPAITREAYDRGREVLDLLEPGVYLKCSACRQWWISSDIKYTTVSGNPTFLCERCS